jgi:hypothetical protein
MYGIRFGGATMGILDLKTGKVQPGMLQPEWEESKHRWRSHYPFRMASASSIVWTIGITV